MPLYIISFLLFIASIIFLQIFLSKNKFFVILLSSAFSILIATSYTVLMATDLAVTEFVISSSLSTIIMVFSLLYINSKKRATETKDKNIIHSTLLFIMTIALFYIINDVVDKLPRSFFEFQTENDLQKFYIENAPKTFKIPSVVTSIVVGYRAFDTMFECMVIFFGSLVFYVILRDRDIN